MSEGVSTFSGICVAVNMMIGAGFLAMPSALSSAGIISSIIILSIICYWMIITCTWEGRAVVRAGRYLQSGRKIPEVTEAFNLYCGKSWRDIYASVLGISFISCSWVLAILFAHTLSSSLPSIYHPEVVCTAGDTDSICNTRYSINVFILFVITTPLALMDISEQWWIQNTLTAIRVMRMILMCVTPLLAWSTEALQVSFPVILQSSSPAPPVLFMGSWYGLAQILSAAIFSQYLNASIPILVDALKDRNNFMRVLKTTFFFCLFLYIVLSIIVSVQFGDKSANPCNLNWTGYRWPGTSSENCPVGSFCDLSARAVEFIVVFCPAVDVASAYPFIGIIMGNSMTEIALGVPMREVTVDSSENQERGVVSFDAIVTPPAHGGHADVSLGGEGMRHYMLLNKAFRFAMNTLPMVLAVTVTDFSTVIQVTGGISVIICLVFPAYLSLKCNEYMSRHGWTYGCGEDIVGGEYLQWVDGTAYKPPASTLHSGYGSIPQHDPSHSAYNPTAAPHSDEIIENPTFKRVFLWVGVIMTGVILYISVKF